jgi:molybdate transport system regulatory protein
MTSPRRSRHARLELKGSLWISVGDQSLGGHGRVALLRAVAEQGSITQAAKAFGMSYKAAWDAIDTMNALAGAPLVERSTGGRGGGSTRLTDRGRRLIERYAELDAVHQQFVRLLDQEAMNLERPFSLLQAVNLRTSARNQWVGTVTAVRSGAVNDDVELTLPGGVRLAAIVTRASTEALGLRTQQTAIAMVKASAVLLADELDGTSISARNRLEATVREIAPGAANAEVRLETDAGLPVVAVVPQSALDELGLAAGRRITAFVQASDVILAVAGVLPPAAGAAK